MGRQAQEKSHKVKMMEQQLAKKLSRQVVGSLVGCVHCGMCNESCHYVLSHPDDPKMTPSYKADQLRKLFKRNHDWTGRVAPWWVGADTTPLTDEDLNKLKDISFGTCTNCRRCTINCPMGVDTATLNRIMRGLLSHVGVMPEGVRVVSKDQWEIGNQMGVLPEDYLDTLEWMSEELEEELGHDRAAIPVDRKGAKVAYAINPREVKYDPRTIKKAALIFYAAGEDWTMASEGWDQTNFGLFSGDDGLGGVCGKRVYDQVAEPRQRAVGDLGVRPRLSIDAPRGGELVWPPGRVRHGELDHDHAPVHQGGSDQGRQESQPRAGHLPRLMQPRPQLWHLRGTRELLSLVVEDFREMYPNRTENFCCTGGGGAMSMSEYTPRRLASGAIKAKQIAETGAKIVVTSCHNCVDGLSDVIKHYELGCKVEQLVDLVANALVLDDVERAKAEAAAERFVERRRSGG